MSWFKAAIPCHRLRHFISSPLIIAFTVYVCPHHYGDLVRPWRATARYRQDRTTKICGLIVKHSIVGVLIRVVWTHSALPNRPLF